MNIKENDEVITPKQYIENLEADWRLEKLQFIRKIIKKSSPKIKEGINYKMLSYELNNIQVFHLNVQKNHVGLYFCHIDLTETHKKLLLGLDHGKGCIRFKKTDDTKNFKGNLEKFLLKALLS